MKSPNGITTILFDLDDTLRQNEPHGHLFFWEHAASLGAPASKEDRVRAHHWAHKYWANSDSLTADVKTHGRGQDSFWQHYTERHLLALGCNPKQASELAPQIHKHMGENYQPEDVVLPEVHETLQILHSAGYRLAVVTNRSEPVNDYLDEKDISKFFDFSLAGGEIKAWKPNPKIFEAALERAGAKPEETMFVGDNYYADIIGARKVGLLPVLIDALNHFPEADCLIINSLAELEGILENHQ